MFQRNTRGHTFRRGWNSRVPRGGWREQAPIQTFTDVGDLLQSASREDFMSSKSRPDCKITNIEFAASYNWMDTHDACISIPGMPPRWTPIEPRKLTEDRGVFYRDPNAANFPTHPIEPAVEAILRMNPASEKNLPREVDLFGCASTMGNLLRFVNGDTKPFRIIVEVIGDAVHLVRRETDETISGIKGYGKAFPDAYTTWDASVRTSTSHQRIVSYCFGGLSCFVRYEGDGFLPADKLGSEKTRGTVEVQPSLEDLLSTLSVSCPSTRSQTLRIEDKGELVPQDSVFDLKTRSIWKKADQDSILDSELPRLWIRQISHLILAFHSSGVFNDIQIRDIRSCLETWEAKNKRNIEHFATLLHRVVELARAQKDGKMEIVYQGQSLEFRRQAPGISPALSDSVKMRWQLWLKGDEQESKDNNSDNITDEASEDSDGYDYTACDKECGYCGRCKY